MEPFLRRIRGASVEDERELLRNAREAAARQLEAMKRELADRVQAVRERERELEAALARAGGPPAVAVAQHDGGTIDQPRLPNLPAKSATEREQIEQRLADLRQAEKQFLRTQTELAARSEEIAARERLVAGRERALGDGESSDRSELTELEARLRRLERAGTPRADEDQASFAAGLESLRRRGTRRQA